MAVRRIILAQPATIEISAEDMQAAIKLWLERHLMQSRQVHEFVEVAVISVRQRGAPKGQPFVITFEA